MRSGFVGCGCWLGFIRVCHTLARRLLCSFPPLYFPPVVRTLLRLSGGAGLREESTRGSLSPSRRRE